jgi:hypothetical protein
MTQIPISTMVKPRRRKRLIWSALVFLLVVLSLSAWVGYRSLVEDWALQSAIAEADRLDPGWRLAEIEAKRDVIPDSENGALLVMAAAQFIPATWPRPTIISPSFDEIIQEQPLGSPLDEKPVSKLRAAISQVSQALGPARNLAGYPQGRHAIAWSRDGIGTLLSHVQSARNVAQLLTMDAMLRVRDGDMEAAVVACRACVNAGRSLGDEPTTMSQLIRLSCRGLALHSLERTLSHGEASGSILRSLQQLLEDEGNQPLMLRMARAERALTHQGLEVIKAREFNRRSYGLVQPFGLPDEAMNLVDAAQARACHAALLRFGTEVVEIAKLPPEEQRDRLEQLKEPDVQQPTIFRAMQERNWHAKIARACWNGDGLLKCAKTALAAERFRQDKGRWPGTLKELTPEYMRTVPTDPFDGKELRFRQLQDGIVIYTLGPDFEDNGGNLTRRYTPPPGTDIGFQLWNPSHRRQRAKRAR